MAVRKNRAAQVSKLVRKLSFRTSLVFGGSILYTREISKIPGGIVKNGKPVFGTFDGCPERLDIRGVRSPFANIPLPSVVTNFRIKSSLSFLFSIGNYIGTVDFFDQKIFGLAEVTIWNRETKRRYAYRKLMGPRRRFIPHNLKLGFCASFQKRRYVRISWDRERNRFSMIFSLRGDSLRPSADAAFVAPYTDERNNEVLSVVPFPTKRRCSATYCATFSIHGTLTLGQTKNSPGAVMEDTDGFSLFRVNRAYYHSRQGNERAAASGMADVGGVRRRVSFFLESPIENQVDVDGVNPNFLFVDGKKTPLPSVNITHTSGISKTWVIQDFENMVDLTFTPISANIRDLSFLVLRAKSDTVYGKFEGVLKTADGEDVVLHEFDGIVNHQEIRG